jgi:hypothetical protein
MALATSVLLTLDTAWEPVNDLRTRLTESAYVWEPVANCWTVRSTDDGWVADWDDSDPQPAPLTTIAWRMWHIGVDCLDSYSSRFGAERGTGLAGTQWVGTATEALDMMDQAWTVFRGIVASWDDSILMTPLGPTWGPYGEQPHLDLATHATREVVHHLAEISLLVDLHLAGGGSL